MQDEKDQLRRQLTKAFNKERMSANEQRLQFENEKARGNELRQTLEIHQLQATSSNARSFVTVLQMRRMCR